MLLALIRCGDLRSPLGLIQYILWRCEIAARVSLCDALWRFESAARMAPEDGDLKSPFGFGFEFALSYARAMPNFISFISPPQDALSVYWPRVTQRGEP